MIHAHYGSAISTDGNPSRFHRLLQDELCLVGQGEIILVNLIFAEFVEERCWRELLGVTNYDNLAASNDRPKRIFMLDLRCLVKDD